MTNAYTYIQQAIEKSCKERSADYRSKIMHWNREPVVSRVERPSNLTRARTLGYKAKQGYAIVRVRIPKGRRKRRHMMGGRKSRHRYLFVQPQLSHQTIAEQRVNRIYKNMEVLNSYWVGEDGNYKFFEVILADPTLVKVFATRRLGRAFRGLTSTGRKARGLGRGRLGLGQQREKD